MLTVGEEGGKRARRGRKNKTDFSPGQGTREERGVRGNPSREGSLLSLSRSALMRFVPLWWTCEGDQRSGGPGKRDPPRPADTEGGALRLGRGGGE